MHNNKPYRNSCSDHGGIEHLNLVPFINTTLWSVNEFGVFTIPVLTTGGDFPYSAAGK